MESLELCKGEREKTNLTKGRRPMSSLGKATTGEKTEV